MSPHDATLLLLLATPAAVAVTGALVYYVTGLQDRARRRRDRR
jgi:hypothetical protein